MLRDFWPTETPTPTDDLIKTILEEMESYGPHEPEYDTLLKKLERLYALKADDRPKRITRDGLVAAGAHVFGILVIVFAERHTILPNNAAKQIGRAMK